MSNALPEPTAQGDLASSPFAHVLLTCQQRALTGTLAIWPEDPATTPGQDRIRLVAGTVVAARFLGRTGALDRGLLPLFSRVRGAYAFYPDVDLVGTKEPARVGHVDPRLVVAASLRGPSRDDVIEQVLASFGDEPVRVRPQADLVPLSLLPKETAFVDMVRGGPGPVAQLAAECELGATTGRRLLYLLTITGALEVWTGASATDLSARGRRLSSITMGAVTPGGDAVDGAGSSSVVPPAPLRSSSPPTPSFAASGRSTTPPPQPAARPRHAAPAAPPAAPMGLATEHAALWHEVLEIASRFDTSTYFDALGVPREAGADAIRKAYLVEVKKWHPDRLPAPLAPLRPWVERIFQHKTQAHDTLVDDGKRAAYVNAVAEGGGTPAAERELAAIVQAAMDQQRAEVLLRRRDFATAIPLLRGAIEAAPNEPDAYDSLAWALYQQPDGDAKEMLSLAQKAAELAPKNDRVLLHLAMIFRRAGREREALDAFSRAAKANPRNVDAQREIRIAQMRGSIPGDPKADAGAKPAEGGLFGRLFASAKKDK